MRLQPGHLMPKLKYKIFEADGDSNEEHYTNSIRFRFIHLYSFVVFMSLEPESDLFLCPSDAAGYVGSLLPF